MRHMIRITILVVVFLFTAGHGFFVVAQNDREYSGKAREGLEHAMEFNLKPSYIIPTHGFYNGWNPQDKPLRIGGAADVRYSFSQAGRGVYQGVGIAVHTFGSHQMLGTPTTVYIFQGAPLALLTERLSIGYEWNLGLSAGWRNNEVVTASPLNIYINVAALFTWSVTDRWDVVFGPEYTHFSNGDTSFPNGGANTVNFRIGAKRRFSPAAEIHTEKIFTAGNPLARRMTYDLILYGGWRADRSTSGGHLNIINKPFPVAGLNFNPLYHFNSYWSAGAALDLMYDRSANSDSDDFLSHVAAGLSARAELEMPIFAVNVGVGYNLFHKGQDLEGLYGMFSLKTFLSRSLFLNLGYRLGAVNYSHNLMFGLGWRF